MTIEGEGVVIHSLALIFSEKSNCGMRLDLFLKTARLITRRSLAQEFCDAGLVSVNGALAKSSKEVKAGDEIEIKRRSRLTKILIVQIPGAKQVSKSSVSELYQLIEETVVAEDPLS